MIASSRADQTPLHVSRNYELRPSVSTPVAERGRPSPGQTLFVAISELPKPSKVPGAALTPVGVEQSPSAPPPAASIEDRRDDVALTRDRRLELLVRQFDRETSVEDDARLLILTQRLRRLVPSVQEGAWDVLIATTSTLEEVSSNLDALKAQFGLR